MSFTDTANRVRHRIPFAYWLFYDAVLAPLLIWGSVSLSLWFIVGIIVLAVAVFFDINEAIVKWALR